MPPPAPTDEIVVRAAGPADEGAAIALLEALIGELALGANGPAVQARAAPDIRRALGAPDARVFLAETSGGAVGLSRADVLANEPIFRLQAETRGGYVDQMYVRPAFRRRGIGRLLLSACEGWFRQLGLRHCLLHAAHGAGPFYARRGYTSSGEMLRRL